MANPITDISAMTFLDQWKEAAKDKGLTGVLSNAKGEIWNSNPNWTKEILGAEGLLYTVLQRMGIEDNHTRNEEWKIDVVVGSKEGFNGLKDMKEEPEELTINGFYPRYYEIAIEHENSIALCNQEMIKLTRIRAKLKVLITYDYEQNSSFQEGSVTLQSVFDNFDRVIRQVNHVFPENQETEYLLIVGVSEFNDKTLILKWQEKIVKVSEVLNQNSN